MSAVKFLKNFVARPLTTGAIAPSSDDLAELITDAAELKQAQLVVEFGTGNGVFTEKVLQKIPPGAKYLGIEINPTFVRETRKRCPGAVVCQDSAVNAWRHLEESGLGQCDCIVCGLPWAWFDEKLQDDLLDTVGRILKPGGRLATFAYLHGLLLPAGQRFRRKIAQRFHQLELTRTVWLNLPPAFVYKAVKAAQPPESATAQSAFVN